jgi:hypothetical protein
MTARLWKDWDFEEEKMITFSRSMLVGGEFLDEKTVRLHGILEDQIYAMEIQIDVSLPEGVILTVQGWMKRYTTPVCPKAVESLQRIAGISLREEGWIDKISKEVGRKGCQHLAEILIECGRCIDSARIAKVIGETMKAQPAASLEQITRSWVGDHPEIQGSCMARP